MRNTLGTILAATGAGLIALWFGLLVASTVTGVLLLAGALLLVIDWDGQ